MEPTIPRLILSLTIALLVGCSSSTPEPEPEPSPTVEAEPVPPTSAMHSRLAGLEAAHDAIVRSDLEGARAAATRVGAAAMPGELPEAWAGPSAELDVVVAALVAADDLDTAASTIAQVAVACADCHAAAGANPQLAPLPPPDMAEGIAAHMVRHRVAAAAMWHSMVFRSEEHWQQGMVFLATGPLEQGDLPGGQPLDDTARAIEAEVHALAAEAQISTEPGERAGIYARMVRLCAACHQHTRPAPATGAAP